MYRLQYTKRGNTTKLSIHRGEWTDFMFEHKCDTIQQLREHIKMSAKDGMQFWTTEDMKHFFAFLFKYLRDADTSRALETEIAARALYGAITIGGIHCDSKMAFFARTFCQFLFEKRFVFKCLNMDQWKIFIDFSRTIAADFSNFDLADAWPTMYDDYVEWVKLKTTQQHASTQCDSMMHE